MKVKSGTHLQFLQLIRINISKAQGIELRLERCKQHQGTVFYIFYFFQKFELIFHCVAKNMTKSFAVASWCELKVRWN